VSARVAAIVGLIGVAFVTAGGYAFYYQPWQGSGWWGGKDRMLIALGRVTYVEHCANCHGTKLEGQPQWKKRLPSGRLPAPPHDASGHTWHHPDKLLFEITKFGTEAVIGGGYESDMLAFKDVLSDNEISAVLAFIKSTWPAREQAYQKKITRNAQEARP
jgi:mono/diheme cytochrome c family protein